MAHLAAHRSLRMRDPHRAAVSVPVPCPGVAQRLRNRLFHHEIEWVGIRTQNFVKPGGWDQQIRFSVSIGVGIDRLSEFTQLFDLLRLERAVLSKRSGRMQKVIAIGADNSPEPVLSCQMTVHEQARTNLGRRIDVWPQAGMFWNCSRKVMIEVFNFDSVLKQRK